MFAHAKTCEALTMAPKLLAYSMSSVSFSVLTAAAMHIVFCAASATLLQESSKTKRVMGGLFGCHYEGKRENFA